MQRYKAKIEDLEATLAQKGQVGARLLAFLQAQLVQAASPPAHLMHGPHPGHGLAHHSDLSQTVSECKPFLSPLLFSQSANSAAAVSEVG